MRPDERPSVHDAHERQILDTVRRFVSREVRPHVAALEKAERYPEKLVARMRELGLFALLVPERFGGLELPLPMFAAVMEELAVGWTTLTAYLNSHSTVAFVLSKYGTPEQQERYLPGMADGAVRGALALTEPGAGSDLQAIATVARPSENGFVVAGRKVFVTNGGRASLLLVLAKTDPTAVPAKRGMSLLLVEKGTPGVTVADTVRKMAYEHVDTTEILLDEAALSRDALLGEAAGRGLSQLLDGLEVGRLAIAASAAGLGASALREALRYARERVAFGAPIAQHQAVQLRLSDMATRLAAARALTREAAQQKQARGRSEMLSGMAKLFASEAALEVVGDALRIHGGYGYIKDFPVERMFREAPLYIVGEGTNDIQKLIIARGLLEEGGVSVLELSP